MSRRFTRIDDEAIAALMATFYVMAREDPLLAPVFPATVGTAESDWAAHLAKVTAYWSSVMATGARQVGRPMQVHSYLRGLTPAHFRRWLEIFALATAEHFPQHLADAFMDKARSMANTLQASMALARGPGRGDGR